MSLLLIAIGWVWLVLAVLVADDAAARGNPPLPLGRAYAVDGYLRCARLRHYAAASENKVDPFPIRPSPPSAARFNYLPLVTPPGDGDRLRAKLTAA